MDSKPRLLMKSIAEKSLKILPKRFVQIEKEEKVGHEFQVAHETIQNVDIRRGQTVVWVE